MKTCKINLLIGAIVCMAMVEGSASGALPSLSAAKSAKTIGALLKVIQTGNTSAGFYKADGTTYAGFTTADATPITLVKDKKDDNTDPLTAYALIKKQILSTDQATLTYLDSTFSNYLLYFTYNNVKYYIINPKPQPSYSALYNIVQHWAP